MDAVAVEQHHPGRWIGGLIGAVVSLAVSGVGLLIGDTGEPASAFFLDGGLVGLGLAGIPVAFLAGRALLPQGRAGGTGQGLAVGLMLGLLAPPLGAVLILFGAVVPGPSSVGLDDALGLLVLLPFAAVFSYVASVVTVPAGLAWAVLVRALPEEAFRRWEAPAPVARLGARHALAVAGVAWLLVAAYPYLEDATDEFECHSVYAMTVAWAPGGNELLVAGGDPELGAAIQWLAADGSRTVVRPDLVDVELTAAGPGGTVAWTAPARRARSGTELWVARGEGARAIGRLPSDIWSALAWWDGSWVALGWDAGLVRLGGVDGNLATSPVRVGRQRVGIAEPVDTFSASADGRRLGWSRRDGPEHTWFALLEGGRFDRFLLPVDAYDATLDGGGRAIVYRDGPLGEWRRFALESRSVAAETVASARWSGVRVAANGSIAAVDDRLRDGRLCIAFRG
jgi:hypothetical protein